MCGHFDLLVPFEVDTTKYGANPLKRKPTKTLNHPNSILGILKSDVVDKYLSRTHVQWAGVEVDRFLHRDIPIIAALRLTGRRFCASGFIPKVDGQVDIHGTSHTWIDEALLVARPMASSFDHSVSSSFPCY